jgi:glycosyltransferase involved in cell wall biosynthesis
VHTPARVSSGPAGRADAPSFGILSTFPPTSCGIATFSAALAAGLIGEGVSVDVVRCGPTPTVEDVLVVGSLADSDDAGHRRAIDALNRNDLVIVQHEYGLYDGTDGESIIELVDAIDAPVVVVAHTVLTEPSENQRRVLERVCRSADAVVVMTRTAHARLLSGYDVDGAKVHVIPHGAATPLAAPSASQRRPGAPLRLLTWGLLGPGKGIEWAIDALGHTPEGPRKARRGLPPHAGRARCVVDRGRHLRRHLPRPDVVDRAHPVGRSRRAAVRLA